MAQDEEQAEPRYGQRLPAGEASPPVKDPLLDYLDELVEQEEAKAERFRPKAPKAAAWRLAAAFLFSVLGVLGAAAGGLGVLWLVGIVGLALAFMINAWVVLVSYWDSVSLRVLTVAETASIVLLVAAPAVVMVGTVLRI